jgi:hypothetical protein
MLPLSDSSVKLGGCFKKSNCFVKLIMLTFMICIGFTFFVITTAGALLFWLLPMLFEICLSIPIFLLIWIIVGSNNLSREVFPKGGYKAFFFQFYFRDYFDALSLVLNNDGEKAL